MKSFSLISALALAGSAGAQTAIQIPNDPKAAYLVLEISGDGNLRTIVTKRTGSSGTTFSKREYDCKRATWRYLSIGNTAEEMNRNKQTEEMTPVVDHSIASDISGVACDKK